MLLLSMVITLVHPLEVLLVLFYFMSLYLLFIPHLFCSFYVIDAQSCQAVAEGMMKVTTSKDGHAKVACLTTDFSMQNVLLQMGLKV